MQVSGERHSTDGRDVVEDSKIVEATERAVGEYGFCPNRVWGVAGSHTDKEMILPRLFPAEDGGLQKIFGQRETHPVKNRAHDSCTFDFCEQSQVNYTSVLQRHESPSCRNGPCGRIQRLFPRIELDEAGRDGRLTAWQLYGRKVVHPGQKFMAISHVWSDGTGAGTWPAGELNKCLYHFFSRIARRFDCDGLWWDTLCIPSDKVARANAINNMQSNYEAAELTLVHDCFLREVEFINAETACVAILMSPWFSRGWTALELANSRTVKVAFKGTKDPVLLDLDKDLLKSPTSERHKIAASMISNLRDHKITDVNHLLRVLGPRHTSWARDLAIISGLLVGVRLEPIQDADMSGQSEEIYQ